MNVTGPAFSDDLGLEDALKRFFDDDLVQDSEGGYSARWAKVKMGPLTLAFPNSQSRVRALKLHDLHHIAADYDTSFVGESEIGAWEIAGGCADHWPAWVLNLSAMAVGIFLAPLDCLRAFARGRRTRNLYRTAYEDALAQGTVGRLRDFLDLRQAPARPSLTDGVLFGLWSAAGVALMLGATAVLLVPVCALVWLVI